MFYRPQDGHGLPHSPLNAIVAPRPIGWVATRGPLGDNLAPFSFFNIVAYRPPQILLAPGADTDTLANIRASGVFSVSVVEAAALAAMNATSAELPRGTDEFLQAGVGKSACTTIDCPRVEGAPATLECVRVAEVPLRGQGNQIVIGEVTGIHLRDDCLVDGRFDVTRFRPLARLGYRDYAVVAEVFAVPRPGDG